MGKNKTKRNKTETWSLNLRNISNSAVSKESNAPIYRFDTPTTCVHNIHRPTDAFAQVKD